MTGHDCTGRGLEWREKTVSVALGIFSVIALRNVQMEVSSRWTYYSGAQGGGLGQRNIPGSPRLMDGQHSQGGK